MSADTEALERLYAAINRNDIDAAVQDFDPDIVRIEPPDFPTAGTYRGIPGLKEHLRKGRGSWAEGSCEPEKFLQNGEKVVACLHVRVRLKSMGEWVGGRFADGFAFRDGRIVEYHSFGERADALKWAGLEEA
jgi:ketosteroid isomerase-like protein